MSKELVELDDEALASAARFYGTTTTTETLNAALREVAQRNRRREALDQLVAMAAAGDFDLLLDKKNYRR